jgi:predicted HD superfamily hydrolase involved in NAD metabolism
MTTEQIKQLAKSTLSAKRYQHTANVKKMAVKLAKLNGEDPEKAAAAAWLHDLAKEKPKEELLQILRDNAIMSDNAASRPAPVWHGVCAAILGKTQWGIEDTQVLDAVACHTTGRPGMTKLDKILFLADMTSAERSWSGVEKLRRLACTDLDAAMLEGLRQTIDFVKQGGKTVDPMSAAAYEDLEKEVRKGKHDR